MKNFFKIFIPVALVAFLAYQFYAPLYTRFSPAFDALRSFYGLFIKPDPCTEPIPYNLGTFDTEFSISKKYFLDALLQAEAIWEKPYGKDLFVYTPQDSTANVLKINLIYDYRQQATSKLASLGITVKDTRESYDMLKAKFTVLKSQYEREKASFASRLQIFNEKKEAYDEAVDAWNKKGGAPKDEYEKLEATRIELQTESKELQTIQNRLNNIVDEINALVVSLNRLANTLNLSVDKYNTINVSRGESFEEGLYVSDGFTREINIYEFSSREKLLRVLAHEFGHALNLDHVDDKEAIMYSFNQGTNIALTEADLGQLRAQCKVEQ